MSALVWILISMAAAASPAPAAPHAGRAAVPAGLDAGAIRSLVLQHDGRWPPLDTVARDLVQSVTGTQSLRGQDPVLVLLAWTFDPEAWRREPLIRIKNAELRRELKLPPSKRVFSYEELMAHRPLRDEMSKLAGIGDRKMNPLESKVDDIQGKLGKLERVFQGEAIRIVPDPEDAGGDWRPVTGGDVPAPVRSAWEALRTAFLAGDAPGFEKASRGLIAGTAALPAATRPDPHRIATEIRYNRTHPFRTAWKLMFAGALLSVASLFVKRRWFDAIAALGALAGFAVLTYGLSARWTIAGRIPASNMFESLLFLSWGMGAFSILATIVARQRLVPLTASVMGAAALFLADVLPMDHFVRPIAPVLLDTIWMSIHVPIIMVSYSVLALGVIVAHIQFFVMAAAPRAERLSRKIDLMHQWYIHAGSILLLIGIVTGSVWAASSWGRYWGWDPKEVWSLVALLGYLAILHVRIDTERAPGWTYGVGLAMAALLFVIVVPKMVPLTPLKILALAAAGAGMVLFVAARGPLATAAKSILAFWLIIMTYVGVNFVLNSGMHSYGFGTGAVARHMLTTGGVDLGLMALCALLYLVRARLFPPAGAGS